VQNFLKRCFEGVNFQTFNSEVLLGFEVDDSDYEDDDGEQVGALTALVASRRKRFKRGWPHCSVVQHRMGAQFEQWLHGKLPL